ncbi:Protein patched 1 [Desmophyllum pertusum]|uniref:Protein patched 1 n=1 Tax=Desmophyllum pertusum TaxID=174260 RepID=A0A9X0CTJ6_9CNID|nr:Protein patched 1 [Desmophyllum pertusum]
MLMGRQQLYEHWHSDVAQAKVQHMDSWTELEAEQVLEAWKREFTKVVNSADQSKEDSTVLAFSSTSFNDLLQDFSQTSYSKVTIGYALMLIYACLTLMIKHWGNAVDSHGALGFAGVLLVTVAVTSGLGFCSFVKIKFNAASTQILPFLALGLGVDDMFLLAHTYATSRDKTNAAIVVVFNFFAVIVIFPAMIVIDRNRRRSGKYDLLCCLKQGRSTERHSISTPPPSTSVSDSGLVHYSCNSLLDTSAVLQGLSGTVRLPGSVQATASQTIHLPNVVTVQASASAELGGTPRTDWQRPKRLSSRRDRRTAESGDIELSAMGNIRSTHGVSTANARAGASASVVQVQLAGSMDAEKRSSRDCITRPSCHQGHRSLKIHPEQSANDSCTCSEAASKLRSKRHAHKSRSRDTVINENAVVLASEVSANAASNGETAVAMAECSSTQESVRTSSSHSRSSPGLESMGRASTSQSIQDSDPESNSRWGVVKKKLQALSLSNFARDYYGPWLQRMPVKISVLFIFACLFAAGVYGSMKVEEGLDLTDVVPRQSPEHKFVEAQFKYFSFYQMVLVTKGGYDYPNGQELLYKFHNAFKKIPNIIKTPEGELPPFWLMYFRDWLIELQKAFDRDWDEGRITYGGWQKNASDDGVMAYKLLAQTGAKETSNKSIVRSVRLVNEEGIIRPETFYTYLMVWYNMDSVGYTFSQANIRPEPEWSWHNNRLNQDYNAMRVEPPAPPINFSFIPFNVINLRETKDFIEIIKVIVSGYDNSGSVWLHGLAGLKLSAVPAVTLILSVGVGVEFTVHMCMQFLTSAGDRNQRMQRAVERVFSPVVGRCRVDFTWRLLCLQDQTSISLSDISFICWLH